eukprot:scaffold1213_cov208-Alexandrium_tamarense.AAC.3
MQWPFGSHEQVAASSRRVIAACFVQTCIRRTLEAQLTDPTSSSRSSSCSIKNHPNAESIIGSAHPTFGMLERARCIVRGSTSMPKLTVDTNSLLCFSCQSAMDN